MFTFSSMFVMVKFAILRDLKIYDFRSLYQQQETIAV